MDTVKSILINFPSHKDDLLHYLNNHKGGFFRFFNSGGAFGDDSNNQYNPHPQKYQTGGQQQHSTLENLAFIQSLANTVNESGGINLSNLGANAGLFSSLANAVSSAQNSNSGAATSVYDQSNVAPQSLNIGDIVGNLLTGVVGNRFTSRRMSKRSIDAEEAHRINSTQNEEIVAEDDNGFENVADNIAPLDDEPEGRILNHKTKLVQFGPIVLFPSRSPNVITENNRQIKFMDIEKDMNGVQINKENVAFPMDSFRGAKKISFDRKPMIAHNLDNSQFFPNGAQAELVQHGFDGENEPHRTKMIFPDRTGTGNLKFDSDLFHSDTSNFRKGKILTGIRQIPIPNESYNDHNSFRPTTVNYDNVQSANGYQSQQNNNYNYQSATINSNNYRPPQLPDGEDVSKNVYVTNAHGVVEYYIKDGNKILV